MHVSTRSATSALIFLLAVTAVTLPAVIQAAPITFSGTVSYQGAYTGDTLYVAVLDTTGVEDVTLLDVQAIAVGSPPLSEAYSLSFDNSGVGAMLLVASFLDVDGGGLDSLTESDVFGWYDGNNDPVGISSTAPQTGLDFSLPRAEIHGTITFAPGQNRARVNVTTDAACIMEGFRPGEDIAGSMPYSQIVYAGTFCVSADGDGSGYLKVCYGDPTCSSPTLITLTDTEVRNGVDLNFNDVVPAERISWGRIKNRYP